MNDKWNWKAEVRAGNDTLGPFPKLRGTGTFGAARNFAQPSSDRVPPPPPPQEWMRVDGLSRESFTLLSYPFNCSPFDLRVEQRGSGAKF